MTTTIRKIESYEELVKLSRTGSKMKGAYELRCLGLVMGRYANLSYAIHAGKLLEKQVDAKVEIHAAE